MTGFRSGPYTYPTPCIHPFPPELVRSPSFEGPGNTLSRDSKFRPRGDLRSDSTLRDSFSTVLLGVGVRP